MMNYSDEIGKAWKHHKAVKKRRTYVAIAIYVENTLCILALHIITQNIQLEEYSFFLLVIFDYMMNLLAFI